MLTFEDLERMPDDAHKHELLEGELVVTPPPGIDHSEIAHGLQDELRPHVKGRGRVYIEAGFQMGTRNWLQPDVSFVLQEHRGRRKGKYLQGAPLLAIEVLSESNTMSGIKRKAAVFLEYGSEEVWVVDESKRSITLHRKAPTPPVIHTGTLTTPVFPDLRLEVQALFG